MSARHVRLKIKDATGNTIPGYTLEDCPEFVGDQVERVVSWKGELDLRSLPGQPLRFPFVLKDADLNSFRFR